MPVVRVNGLDIGYDRVGDGPPLVLAHGGASDAREWRPQLEGLGGELTVVAWDEPGSGRSSDIPPGGLGLAGIADALAALIAELGLAPVYLGGLSWGGVVALEAYRRHPGLVTGLILCDTYAGWKGSLPLEEIEERLAGLRAELDSPGEFRAVLPGLFAAEPSPAVVAEMEAVMADVRPESMRHTFEAIAAADLSGFLPRIAVPTLLIWGEQDVRSPLRVACEFHAAIPDSQLVVIPGAGHMSNMERPDDFNRAVLSFVAPPAASQP
jgi:pimeloyl-ACP methyl ester carboxylesterase